MEVGGTILDAAKKVTLMLFACYYCSMDSPEEVFLRRVRRPSLEREVGKVACVVVVVRV